MKRREFITLLGGAAVAWPIATHAQQSVPVIGLLGAASAQGYAAPIAAFRQGLQEAGYREGRSVAIEYRWADNHYDRLPAMAADLVRRQVNVLVAAGGTPPALAAKAATTTIPIVFRVGVDPVGAGLVASLNRPGGNVTGVASLSVELVPKRLELLHELVPRATVVAVLINPTNPALDTLSRDLAAAAGTLGLQLHVLHATTERDLDTVFATLAEQRIGALVISVDALFTARSEQIAALALRHAMPTAYQWREFVAAGGIMSYGPKVTDAYRQVGVYAGRILQGAKPADLPVYQATKFELILNLKTAKALGIEIPAKILALADEVIE